MSYKFINNQLLTYLETRLEFIEKFTVLMDEGILDIDDNKIHERNILLATIKELKRIEVECNEFILLINKLKFHTTTEVPDNSMFRVILSGVLSIEDAMKLQKKLEQYEIYND